MVDLPVIEATAPNISKLSRSRSILSVNLIAESGAYKVFEPCSLMAQSLENARRFDWRIATDPQPMTVDIQVIR